MLCNQTEARSINFMSFFCFLFAGAKGGVVKFYKNLDLGRTHGVSIPALLLLLMEIICTSAFKHFFIYKLNRASVLL